MKTNAELFADALGLIKEPSKTDKMFNRAEALQNTAKAIKGIRALDDDALEVLYAEAKAERRERKKAEAEKLYELLRDVLAYTTTMPNETEPTLFVRAAGHTLGIKADKLNKSTDELASLVFEHHPDMPFLRTLEIRDSVVKAIDKALARN